MLRADSLSPANFGSVSTDAYRSPRLQPAPPRDESRQWQLGTHNGTGTISIESVLPKARDRLVTIAADAPLTVAAELLFEPTCRMVVACDPAGAMAGVITRTDIIRQVRHCQGCGCATRCMMIMSRHVFACRPDDRLHEVWAIMKEKELHSIPVVDSKRRPLGLLSARDALQALLASAQYEENLLRDYVMGLGYR